MVAGDVEPDAIAAKLIKNPTPVSSEYKLHRVCFRRLNRAANTNDAPINA